MNIRTIKLTDDELSLILRALGIAEMKFNELRRHYIEQVPTSGG